jgi:hypothetical protein
MTMTPDDILLQSIPNNILRFDYDVLTRTTTPQSPPHVDFTEEFKA